MPKKTTTKKKNSKQLNKCTTRVIVLSIFISMIVGSCFGFLVSLAVNRNLKTNLEKELISGDLAEKAQQELDKIQKEYRKTLDQDEATVTQVVEKANPAVVSIIISKDVPIIERYYKDPFEGFKEFEEFFGPFGSGIPYERQTGTQKQEIGGGSGFLVSKNGYVLTNKHVVLDEQAEYTVLTNDEKLFKAEILGRDPINDIAMLKIDPQAPEKGDPLNEFSYLKLGDSNQLKVGQTVIAIGNSLGEFRNTVSKGIVSGLKRNITAGNSYGQREILSELIQTDAAVNQGNSGGPLLNLNGEVIGINVAMAAGAENIGFALPINSIKPIVESVQKEGKIIRPFMGVRYIINNKIIAEKNKLPYDWGALVQRGENIDDLAVIPGYPADKAGIRENDLILEIDGKKIDQKYNPAQAIMDKKPGDKISLRIWSKGKLKIIELTLEER